MNYVILNYKELFEDSIVLNGLKEVDLYGTDRVDVIFLYLNEEILGGISGESGGGDSVLPEQWLLRDGGVSVILCKIDKNILYSENTELIEEMFGLFDKERFYIEVWGDCEQKSYNQLEQYIIVYNKNFGHQEILQDDNIEEENSLKALLMALQRNLF